MEHLGKMGITSILIEAGSSFNASALTAGVVDKVIFFIAPKIICGRASIQVVGGESFFKLEDCSEYVGRCRQKGRRGHHG